MRRVAAAAAAVMLAGCSSNSETGGQFQSATTTTERQAIEAELDAAQQEPAEASGSVEAIALDDGTCLPANWPVIEITAPPVDSIVPGDVEPRLHEDDGYVELTWTWDGQSSGTNDYRELIVRSSSIDGHLEIREAPIWAKELGFPNTETIAPGVELHVDMEFREGVLPDGVDENDVDPWYQLVWTTTDSRFHVLTRGIVRSDVTSLPQLSLVQHKVADPPASPSAEYLDEVFSSLLGLSQGEAVDRLIDEGFCVEEFAEFMVEQTGNVAQTEVIGVSIVNDRRVQLDLAVSVGSDNEGRDECQYVEPDNAKQGVMGVSSTGVVDVHLVGNETVMTSRPEDAFSTLLEVGQARILDGVDQVLEFPSLQEGLVLEPIENTVVTSIGLFDEDFAILRSHDGVYVDRVTREGEVIWRTQIFDAEEQRAIVRSRSSNGRVLLGLSYIEGGIVPSDWFVVDGAGAVAKVESTVQGRMAVEFGSSGELLVLGHGTLTLADGSEHDVGGFVDILGELDDIVYLVDDHGSTGFLDLNTGEVTLGNRPLCFVEPPRFSAKP